MSTTWVTLGRVVGAHGLRGEIRIRFAGDGPENLCAARRLWLTRDDREDGGQGEEVEVRGVRSGRPGEVRMALQGVADRDAAKALVGRTAKAPAETLGELEPGQYYHFQLIGCRVEGHDGTPIGIVREIMETGAHDVLVVEGDDHNQHLLPAAADLLREVDLKGRRIVIELLPGLIEGR